MDPNKSFTSPWCRACTLDMSWIIMRYLGTWLLVDIVLLHCFTIPIHSYAAILAAGIPCVGRLQQMTPHVRRLQQRTPVRIYEKSSLIYDVRGASRVHTSDISC